MRGIVRHSWTAFSLAATMSISAFARPVPDRPSIVVPVEAQDFATAAAMEGLTKRIQSAAHEVCNDESWSDDGYLFTHVCYVTALQDAMAQLDRLRAGRAVSLAGASILVEAR